MQKVNTITRSNLQKKMENNNIFSNFEPRKYDQKQSL